LASTANRSVLESGAVLVGVDEIGMVIALPK